MSEAKAKQVFDWYEKHWNLSTPFSKKRPLTLDTSLSTGRYPWARETGDDIMKDYFSRFDADDTNFDFIKYWLYEKGLIPNFLRTRSMRFEEKEPEELTITMLIESAKAGRWLY
ncbi:DUF1493 family protein [Erwinia billingiae]|uniref:DUF1493 family protein n=1 Tax=Erwinia billingiae TaxID=182337 RepID=UPI003D1631FB